MECVHGLVTKKCHILYYRTYYIGARTFLLLKYITATKKIGKYLFKCYVCIESVKSMFNLCWVCVCVGKGDMHYLLFRLVKIIALGWCYCRSRCP